MPNRENVEELLNRPLTIGQVLWAHRKCEYWTQKEVAKMLRITFEEYVAYEEGTMIPTENMIVKIAKLFGVSEKVFLSYRDEQLKEANNAKP